MKDFIEFLKLPPNILGALAVASGILLFLPAKIATKLYILNFRNKYGFTLGIIFIVSISILIILLTGKIIHKINKRLKSKKLIKSQTIHLMNMNPEQVAVISEFLNQPTHTLPLPYNNGLVIELQHYHIITPAGHTQLVNMLNPQIIYFLQPWVIQRINDNEELQEKFY